MARNRERTGAQNKNTEAPPVPTQQNNDSGGFSFVVPTEFVELPSQGRYYPEGHALHGRDTIEIKQMTAKEEDLLTSRALLKKGVAIDRLIQSVIVNKQINTDTLLAGDRNAILIATRVSGYGSDYETKIACPGCTAQQDYNFNLQDAHVYDGQSLDGGIATSQGDGTFLTTLPRTKIEVTFRLLNGADERQLVTQIENARKRRQDESPVTRQLRQFIVAVNGDTTQEAINYLVDNVPSIDARHLRTAYKLATPNIDLTQTFECNECDYEQDMEVPLTADFFWPDR